MENRIKTKDLPAIRAAQARKQGYTCSLCDRDLMQMKPGNSVLDHCHDTGNIREVLCRNCNGILGKVENLATRASGKSGRMGWILNAVSYVERHRGRPSGIIHPTFKNEDEKRERRNMLARKRRAEKKAEA